MLGQGLISFLPMGMKVFNNLKKIIALEMNGLEGEEIQVPLVNPLSLWQKSGRSEFQDNPPNCFYRQSGAEAGLVAYS